MSPEALMVLGLVLEVLLGVMGFLVVRAVFGKLDEIAKDVKEVKVQVSIHADRLARVETFVEVFKEWKRQVEDRERAA